MGGGAIPCGILCASEHLLATARSACQLMNNRALQRRNDVIAAMHLTLKQAVLNCHGFPLTNTRVKKCLYRGRYLRSCNCTSAIKISYAAYLARLKPRRITASLRAQRLVSPFEMQ